MRIMATERGYNGFRGSHKIWMLWSGMCQFHPALAMSPSNPPLRLSQRSHPSQARIERDAFADMLFQSVFKKPDPTRMKTPAVGWTARFLYLSVEGWIPAV